MVEEARSEAHVSAEQPAPGQAPRVPGAHVDPRRSSRDPRPASEGPAQAVGLIHRVRRRSDLIGLRSGARQGRSGPISVRCGGHGTHEGPPRVAYAIGRQVGSAPVRNRVRRRLREILRAMAANDPAAVRPAVYLIRVHPGAGDLSSAELARHLARALAKTEPQQQEDL